MPIEEAGHWLTELLEGPFPNEFRDLIENYSEDLDLYDKVENGDQRFQEVKTINYQVLNKDQFERELR